MNSRRSNGAKARRRRLEFSGDDCGSSEMIGAFQPSAKPARQWWLVRLRFKKENYNQSVTGLLPDAVRPSRLSSPHTSSQVVPTGLGDTDSFLHSLDRIVCSAQLSTTTAPLRYYATLPFPSCSASSSSFRLFYSCIQLRALLPLQKEQVRPAILRWRKSSLFSFPSSASYNWCGLFALYFILREAPPHTE